MKTLRYIFVAIYVLFMAGCADFLDKGPVSYTHLTLPTSDLV